LRDPLLGSHFVATTAVKAGAPFARPAGYFANVDGAVGSAPKFAVQNPLVSVPNPDDFIAVLVAGSHDGAQTRIHPRRVAAAAQNANFHRSIFSVLSKFAFSATIPSFSVDFSTRRDRRGPPYLNRL
jgi:hypothetical protein